MKKWYFLLLLFLSFCAKGQQTDSLLRVLKTAKNDTLKVNTLYDLGYSYWLASDDSLATFYCKQSVYLAQKLKFFRGEAKARLQLARIELDRFTDIAPAYAQLDTALKIALQIGDKKLEGMTYLRRGQFYNEVLEKQSQANPLFDKALKLFEAIGDKASEGTVYNQKAQVLALQGKFADAIVMILKARKLQEEVNDTASLRSTIPNLGVFYSSMGLYPEALKTFDEAEMIAKKRNDQVLMAFLYNQRAEIFDKQKKYLEALLELEKAVKIHEASQAPYWLARTYARMGNEYLKLNDYNNGLRYTAMADGLFSKSSDANETLDHYVQQNYGKIYLWKKVYRKVISYAAKGLEWAMEADPPLLRESAEYHRQLSLAYEALGQPSLALRHAKMYKTQSDSLLNNEAVQRITAASMTYTFDKKQQTDKLTIELLENEKLTQFRNFLIGLSSLGFLITGFIFWSNRKLRHKNLELVGKNNEIEEALFKGQKIERKRVASELHDNLNTKLAALRWRMEAMNVADYDAGDQKIHKGSVEMLDDIYDDVRLISHSMLPAELETEGLLLALRKLIDKLNINSKTEFHLVVNEFNNRPPAAVEHQLYIIILELINNVLKHAQATQVWVSVGRSGGKIVLTVSDNGVGMAGAAISDGMGMRNLSGRVEALGGKLDIESAPESGTKILIEVLSNHI
jgi:signal transduction histidine kinase